MNQPNHSIQRTGASRSGRSQFLRQWRLAPTADADRWIASTRYQTAVALLMFGLFGCAKPEGLPVQFVIPDGYRGVFSVTLDKKNGVAVPLTNAQFIVTIPASGTLAVSSSDCMSGRHVVSVRYASGELLPTGHDPNVVALRLVTYKPDTATTVYLIGTEKEAHEASEKY